MRHRSLVLAALIAALPLAGGALAQGMPGATVGLPLGSPDPFGTMTNRRTEPEPAAEPHRSGADARFGERSPRRIRGHHHGSRTAGSAPGAGRPALRRAPPLTVPARTAIKRHE